MSELTKPQFESRTEGRINLSSLVFKFCDEKTIKNHYLEKLEEIGSFDEWYAKNEERIRQNQSLIEQAVSRGEIVDSNPETVWKFTVDSAKKGEGTVSEIKRVLEGRVEEIRDRVSVRLGRFLPDWHLDKAEITFTMNKDANFCVDEDKITADLGRLMFEENPFDRVIEGVTHELFHVWMSKEGKEKLDVEGTDDVRFDKKSVMGNMIDEGLAVLVSGQSLDNFYEKRGRAYFEVVSEAFTFFERFKKASDYEALTQMKKEGFESMGCFYVVGNEMVRTLFKREGIEKFRERIAGIRKDPSKMVEIYEEIQNIRVKGDRNKESL